MQTLSHVSHEHHARLREYVDQLYEMATCSSCDCLDTGRLIGALATLRELHEGLTTMLIPHMEAVEAVVYPTLERLMADRAASVPMLHEHGEIRRLVASMGRALDQAEQDVDRGQVLAMRRLLLRLHVLLKTHLSEEELYLPILENRLTPGQEAALARSLDHIAEARL
jgi:iron-sulfur cluster repair protein YtfE (RIC family)